MFKIAITGPESTGKSFLTQALASYFKAPYAPEYSRIFLERTNGAYVQSDLDKIAEGQEKLIHELLPNSLIFSDTEMLVMKIWSEFKYGQSSEYIQRAWLSQDFDHYFLCAPDIAFEEDPLRENPSSREELFELYLHELKLAKRPFTIINGEGQQRIQKAIDVIENLI